jgi:hypothetical protein
MMYVYLTLLLAFLMCAVFVVARLGRTRPRASQPRSPFFILPSTQDSGRAAPPRTVQAAPGPLAYVPESELQSPTVTGEAVRAKFPDDALTVDDNDFGILTSKLAKRRLDTVTDVFERTTKATKAVGGLVNTELDNEIEYRARRLHIKYQDEVARLDFELERAETELAVEVIRAKQRDLMSRISELQRIGVVSR